MRAKNRERQKLTSGKRTALTVAQVVIALLIVAGGIWLVVKMVGYQQGQQVYREIESAYASQDITNESHIDFAALQEKYPNVVAWIKMDDVDVSYPIVQGSDNEYYLHCDPSGQQNVDGSIFLDYRNKYDFSDEYSVIYGHNMVGGKMFGDIKKYYDQKFFEELLSGT